MIDEKAESPSPSCWTPASLVRWNAPHKPVSARWTPEHKNNHKETFLKMTQTSISLVFLSLTMSLSSIRSLLPLSVKTTTKDLGEAFCRATKRPWNNWSSIEKTPTFEFDLVHLSQTLLAVPAPIVALKLQLSGRTSKVGNTVRVQLRRNPLSNWASTELSDEYIYYILYRGPI